VGDEYFSASRGSEFEDLDLLAIGPVVADLSSDFDRYWDAGSSYPVASILGSAAEGALADLRLKLGEEESRPSSAGYAAAIRESLFWGVRIELWTELEWAAVSMLSDDPAKGENRVKRGELLADQLSARVGSPDRRLSLISAYFVPGQSGTAGLVAAAGRGIEVDVLTNALESTDVAAVHAGYARHRKALLRAGVRLWELKSRPRDRRARLRLGIASRPGRRPVIVSSGTSLHAKTLAVDGRRLFVGSFNFDPRSVALNTELGFLVESPRLADQLHALFAAELRARAYEVRLSPGGGLVWVEDTPQGPLSHTVEPGTRLHQRLAVKALSLLPIDWLL
jgi:putative cardiolipin synthase